MCYFVAEPGDTQRWSQIRTTLKLLFDLQRIPRLDQRLKELFDLRDAAAHPWVSIQPTVEHSTGVHVSKEVGTFTPAAATAGIDVACELLDHCARSPLAGVRRARRWSEGHREGVERLLAERARA